MRGSSTQDRARYNRASPSRLAFAFLQRGLAVLMRRFKTLFALLAALVALVPAGAAAERIRDVGQFEGMRTNQLTGYGVVVGLQGTGDDNLEYVTEAMRGVSGRLGLQLPPGVTPNLRNAAAVIITADLPAFSKPGQRIDITVSTLGQARSLRGGALVLGPALWCGRADLRHGAGQGRGRWFGRERA